MLLGAQHVPRPTGPRRTALYASPSVGCAEQAPQLVPPPPLPRPSRARPSVRPGGPRYGPGAQPPVVQSESSRPPSPPPASGPEIGSCVDDLELLGSEVSNSSDGVGHATGSDDIVEAVGAQDGAGDQRHKGGGDVKGSMEAESRASLARKGNRRHARDSQTSSGQDNIWQDDFYRPAFVQDPWAELYAQHPSAPHLRAHLDPSRNLRLEIEREQAKATAALEEASEKEALDARLQKLGLEKAAAAAAAVAEKAAAAADAAAAAKAKEEPPKATSIYDFFEDGDDGFM